MVTVLLGRAIAYNTVWIAWSTDPKELGVHHPWRLPRQTEPLRLSEGRQTFHRNPESSPRCSP